MPTLRSDINRNISMVCPIARCTVSPKEAFINLDQRHRCTLLLALEPNLKHIPALSMLEHGSGINNTIHRALLALQ